MDWIAPSWKDSATDTLEKRLWDAAYQFRANSGLSKSKTSAGRATCCCRVCCRGRCKPKQ